MYVCIVCYQCLLCVVCYHLILVKRNVFSSISFFNRSKSLFEIPQIFPMPTFWIAEVTIAVGDLLTPSGGRGYRDLKPLMSPPVPTSDLRARNLLFLTLCFQQARGGRSCQLSPPLLLSGRDRWKH